jgi:uncharacterized protein YcbX
LADIVLSGINIFPIKSAAGISLPSARITDRGFEYDRRWMLTDTDFNFLSQRKFPKMAFIHTEISDNFLQITAPEQTMLRIPLSGGTGKELSVDIWSDKCPARSCGRETDLWFSQFLGMDVHLVYMPDSTHRMTDPEYGEEQRPVSFADGYPFLLISEASLTDLNTRMEAPLEMKRFRPNLEISGCQPYEEDSWKMIQIGEVKFELVKPCSRCSITTVDPDTAEVGKEPLKTLATYRKRGSKVYFGQNLIHRSTGVLSLNMPVKILQ